jgi:hypothetical protein
LLIRSKPQERSQRSIQGGRFASSLSLINELLAGADFLLVIDGAD